MIPNEVAKSYDLLAEQWNSEAFPRANGIEPHQRAIAFLKEKRYALDLGCGSSGRFIDLLIGQDFEVEGLDLSGRMIELARQRHPTIIFHQANICDWVFPRQYDFISAWDSLWHVPLADQAPVLKRILHHLTLGGVCIFTTAGVDTPAEKVDAAMGLPMYYSALGIPATLELLGEAGCICRHPEYDQYPELHLYMIAQRV